MGADLSIEARMIAVADVFGALSEDRPYRDGLELENIVSIIKRLVPHKLDGDCFDALLSLSRAEGAVESEMNTADESSVRTLEATNAAKAAEAAA
jgi:HD-GYP domain-containing protein (c-di-GMP phosphodiesterase class II)